MAESTSVALAAAPIPTSAEIARAEKFVRERFLHEGEDPQGALAPGSPRRRALDRALAEIEAAEANIPPPPGGGSSRCCSASSGSSPTRSPSSPTAPSSRLIRWTRSRAPSPPCSPRPSGRPRTATAAPGASAASPELLASAAILGPDEVSAGASRRCRRGRAGAEGRGRESRTRRSRTRTTDEPTRMRTRTRRTRSSGPSSGRRPRGRGGRGGRRGRGTRRGGAS